MYHEHVSEVRDHFGADKFKLKGGQFDKASLVPSSSAFTNDVSHIKSFGADQGSPFERPVPVQEKPSLKWPSRMITGAFSKAPGVIIKSNQENPDAPMTDEKMFRIEHSDPTRWLDLHEKPKSTSA